jgi:hypothetical protein
VTRSRPRLLLAGLLVVIAAIGATLGRQFPASSSSPARPPAKVAHRGAKGLDPALLDALRQARADAADDGVELVVESGRRTPEHQERLLQEAVAKYGSREQAARWVATPNTSAHVSGDAVDIGPFEATAWLSEHGAEYGLCQIYGNEPWHYELRPEAVARGCPPIYPDPTHDPRMQR